mgnify:CR=1 FL=1
MKKILITGGLGYIGTKFLDSLYENLEILVFDTNYFTNKSLNNSSLLVVNDIRNFKNDYLEGVDVVIHMSELSNDPLGEFNPSLTNQVNHLSTKELLDKCNASSIKKFIYMSSASVYGFNENILDEGSKTNPLTQYAKSKVDNEKYILDNDFNFETVILRNSTVFGFSNNLRLDLVVNDLTYNAVVNNEIELISDGSPKRPFIHVQDLCNLINLIINTDQNLDKEIINTGANSLNYSIKEIAEIVGELTGVEKLKIGKKDSDQRSYYLDFTKLNTLISEFEIQFDLRSGINDLIKNLKTYDLSGNERRLQKLNKLIEAGKLDKNLRWI